MDELCPQFCPHIFLGFSCTSQMFNDFHRCFIRRNHGFPMAFHSPSFQHPIKAGGQRTWDGRHGKAMGPPLPKRWLLFHGKTMGKPCFMIFFEGFPEFQLAQWRNRRVESFHWNGNELNATLSVTSAKLRRACSIMAVTKVKEAVYVKCMCYEYKAPFSKSRNVTVISRSVTCQGESFLHEMQVLALRLPKF